MSRRFEESSDDDSDEDYDLGTLAAGFLYLVHNGRVVQKKETRALTRFYHTRASLPPNPRMGTPWQQLYASKIDRAFILTTGLDHETFEWILQSGFASTWDETPIPRSDTAGAIKVRLGRRSLDATGALGLCLHFLNSTAPEYVLQSIFGLTAAVLSR